MTLSKKVALLITCALGIQLTANAFFNNPQTPYSAKATKGLWDKSIILTFAQDLRDHNTSKEARTIAQWLNTQCLNGSRYYHEILEILQNNDLTKQTKLTLFSTMIAEQKKNKIKQFVSDVCGGIICVGTFGLFMWAVVESAKHVPNNVVYIDPLMKQPKSVTVTIRRPIGEQPFFLGMMQTGIHGIATGTSEFSTKPRTFGVF